MNKELNTYIPYVNEGMSYEEIKKIALKNGVEGEQLVVLMRALDRYILERDEVKATKSQATEMIWIGIAFCVIAAMMSLYMLLDADGHYIYIVYFIFAGGLIIFYNGWQRKKYLHKEDTFDED